MFSIGRAIVGGCEALATGYGVLVAVALIVLIIHVALGIGQEVFRATSVAALGERGELVGGLFGLTLSLLFFAPLNAGVALVGVHAYRGERLCISEMFAGFRRFFTVLAVNVLTMLVIGACMLPMIAGFAGSVLLANGSPSLALVQILAGVAISLVLCISTGIRLSFSMLACLDPTQNGPGPIESMRLSWMLTSRIVPHLLVVYLLVGLIVLSSLLMLGIGFILVGQPLALGMVGAAYALAVGRPGSDAEDAAEPDFDAAVRSELDSSVPWPA
ncbi:MAG: hypothetical protein ACYS0D_07585 [Planctomycetota bacterium]|jgi:hypothetical protein